MKFRVNKLINKTVKTAIKRENIDVFQYIKNQIIIINNLSKLSYGAKSEILFIVYNFCCINHQKIDKDSQKKNNNNILKSKKIFKLKYQKYKNNKNIIIPGVLHKIANKYFETFEIQRAFFQKIVETELIIVDKIQ